MHLTVYPTAVAYLAKTQAALERNEVANNLMLGTCLRLVGGGNPWGNDLPYLVTVTEGYQFCTLFTDQANPTANSIYQKIGYCPVCDFVEYEFS